ncbi:GATA transcription factor 21-like [Euphorbia lathyris]|uniref:GATA transcription factor 21-like n=1 Tax=Euphorbia lathyris TaxID=212925 RepID=UPI0033133285
MTTVYLNSSFPDLNEDLFLSPNLSEYLPKFNDHRDQEVVDYISASRLSDPKPPSSSSSSSTTFEASKNERSREKGGDGINISTSRGMEVEGSSTKWNIPSTDKPLKYTLRFHATHKDSSSIRVCSDCNTTTTPLWRSGPKGPKSLCNACGIRQRKARRAMAAAAEAGMANGNCMGGGETYSSSKVVQNKEKKLRTGTPESEERSSLNNFTFTLSNNNNASSALHPVFPHDVEQAAILLMELSYGLVHAS